MGIYPTTDVTDRVRNADGTETWTEVRREPGVVHTRTVVAQPWELKERSDCFCCSCDPDGGSQDPACRNHGFAAQRPCEVHDMPGQPWDGTDHMPESVQAFRERVA